MKMQRVGIFSNGVSHRWVCERNEKRERAEVDSYQEIELSELMAVMGCSLISVYIHGSGGDYGEGGKDFIGFLQADAM